MEQLFSASVDTLKKALPLLPGLWHRKFRKMHSKQQIIPSTPAYIAKEGLNIADKSIKDARMLSCTLDRIIDHTEWINRYANSLSLIIKSLNDLQTQMKRAVPAATHQKNNEYGDTSSAVIINDDKSGLFSQQVAERANEIVTLIHEVTQELGNCTRELDNAKEESNAVYKLTLQMKNNYLGLLEAAEQTSMNIDLILASTETIGLERTN
jgi:hypothetical protein